MLRLDINIWVHLLHLCILQLPNKYYSTGFLIISTNWVSYCSWSWGLFCESPNTFSSPKSCSVFFVFAFKIKVPIILKMIKSIYQLTKQYWLVCELGTELLFNRFWFWNLPLGLLEKWTPGPWFLVLSLTFIIKLDTTLQSRQTVKHTSIGSINKSVTWKMNPLAADIIKFKSTFLHL